MNEDKLLIIASFLDRIGSNLPAITKEQMLDVISAIVFDKVAYVKKGSYLMGKIKKDKELFNIIGKYLLKTYKPSYSISYHGKCYNCNGNMYMKYSGYGNTFDRVAEVKCNSCKYSIKTNVETFEPEQISDSVYKEV